MKVEIVPLGFLKTSIGHDSLVLDLEVGGTVREALAKLGVQRGVVATAVINDKAASLDTALEDGDRVKLVPYTGAG
jgi:molybdopterin converting factor small subunit